MAYSRRGFIRAGAVAVPGLVCAVFAADAQASGLLPSDPASVEEDGRDLLRKGAPLCGCQRCRAGDPPLEHLL